MPFSGYRDIIQRRDRRLDTRQERRRQWRAVIVDSQGNQSGNGDIWADENARRLWVMPVGGGQPYQVLCVRIGRPVIGLGVIVGYAEGSNTQEVLRDDYEFLGPSNVGISWMSPSDTDFQPGGRMQLWIQTKMIQPLATYPISGLTVGVVGGDYVYGHERKTYAGTTSQDLTASQPASGQHRLVGLYLDSANTLQTIDGTAVAVAATPPEPSWPAGAFRLSVVRIANPQTSIAFLSETNPLNDIFDRRMAWTDENAGGNIWPDGGQILVHGIDYATITAAVAAASSSDEIYLGQQTLTEAPTINKFVLLRGVGNTLSICRKITSSAGSTFQELQASTTAQTEAIEISSGGGRIFDCRFTVVNTDTKAVWVRSSTVRLYNCEATAEGGAGNQYGLYVDGPRAAEVYAGVYRGATADIFADTNAVVTLYGPVLYNASSTNYPIAGAGTVEGYYYDLDGNSYFANGYGVINKIWLHDVSTGIKKRYTTLALALAAADTGDTIEFDGTQTITANFDITKAITLQGVNPETSIINTSTNSLTAITLSGTGACCRNFKVTNSGAGSGGAGIFWTASSVILEDLIISVTGAGTTNYGIGPSGAVTGTVKNCQVTVSGGTSNYGFAAVVGNSTTSIYNSQFSATTFDFYGTISGATATLNNSVLANGSVSFAGTFNWMPDAKINKNLLYHSLTYDIWDDGATRNDVADDTYVAMVWNHLNNGQAPDISRQADAGTDPFTYYLRCTFDSATSQAGFVQFFEYADTAPLRGQTVSLSFDAWGTDVVELRAAVVYWTSTADAITSDVVGTWSTNNPTLATNWAYANTPAADITITTTRTRYAVNNITIPTSANNIGVFIWTSAEEGSGDLFNLARVQLERGPVATEFVAIGRKEEETRTLRFAYVLDASSNSVNNFVGAKFSTTVVSLNRFPPVVMHKAPVLSHNVTGYTAGAPGTTTVALIDFGAGGFATITGALTLSASGTPDAINLALTAGTSWSGTAGNVFMLRVGPSVIILYDARL